MLIARESIEKPWISTRDPYARIAYILTYSAMFLGVIGGAIRCWASWNDTPVLQTGLCLVMDENFDSPDEVFGENGKFFREVEMSGFGWVSTLLRYHNPLTGLFVCVETVNLK